MLTTAPYVGEGVCGARVKLGLKELTRRHGSWRLPALPWPSAKVSCSKSRSSQLPHAAGVDFSKPSTTAADITHLTIATLRYVRRAENCRVSKLTTPLVLTKRCSGVSQGAYNTTIWLRVLLPVRLKACQSGAIDTGSRQIPRAQFRRQSFVALKARIMR